VTPELSEAVLSALKGFAKSSRVLKSKGKLCVSLVVTNKALESGLPLDLASLRTPEQGQVAGLGKAAVQRILARYGISRVLAEEGGRTSRGSLGAAEEYARLLNRLHESGELSGSDTRAVEAWWVEQVKAFFRQQCFRLDLDVSKSVSVMVRSLLDAARKRQSETPGTMIEGTVLQHLVGAKLALALPPGTVRHNASSTADASTNRVGDFEVGDTAVHVTTSPSESLIEKCVANIGKGFRPLIVCSGDRREAALQLAENAGAADRIEVYEAEVFISMNVNEWAKFRTAGVAQTSRRLVKKYNEIVTEYETDPSLAVKI